MLRSNAVTLSASPPPRDFVAAGKLGSLGNFCPFDKTSIDRNGALTEAFVFGA
ncbi:MAG: hypothetical protein JWP25_949, partial [Bradyrhizobium sp.]|nr:hypothetical protein [Bradyrhizobium sp.]